jgi:putative C-S lyase
MRYDFTTRVNRKGTGAAKWEVMYRRKADISEGVVPFSVADMEFVMPVEIIAGLKEYLDHAILGYAVTTPSYLRAVAGWMKKRHNWDVKEEWIIHAPGVIAALYCAVDACTEKGDGVIIMPPVYSPFAAAISKYDRELVKVPLVEEGTAYRIDFRVLEEKARDPRNRMLLFCSPHNPGGRVWTAEELASVADICERHHLIVVSDEIHCDILSPGSIHRVFASLSEAAAQNSVICTAPSKTFNLAGMQLANIIVPNKELREKLRGKFAGIPYDTPGILSLKACEIAYTQCEAWLDELLVVIAANFRLVADFMAKKLPMIKVFPLEGTYLVWMDFRGLGLDQGALEDFLTNDAELILSAGANFGEEGRGFQRMNLACPAAVLEEALDRLFEAAGRRNLLRGF